MVFQTLVWKSNKVLHISSAEDDAAAVERNAGSGGVGHVPKGGPGVSEVFLKYSYGTRTALLWRKEAIYVGLL